MAVADNGLVDMEKIKSSRITKATAVALAISILSASVYSSNEGTEQSPTSSNSSFTSNIDIDGNEKFDALTDGLLILRSMFGLTDSPLITGAVAGDALYIDAEDIQSRIQGLGNRLDIDNDGNIDALTDGLVTLRYLFGLTGDPLISDVIATGADRVTAEDIEAYMAVLTSLDTEPPVFTSQETFTAPENQTAIGIVTATDANSPSIAFSVSGSELAITSDGVLSFASAPDYETKTSYTATVTASDGTNLTTQDIVVSVSNVDEAPIMGVLSYTVDENQMSIGSVVATDPEEEAVSFSVSGSELAITSAGVLTFGSAPDYETKSSYTATVTATDGTNSTDQSVTVTVTDVDDEAPVFTSSATFSTAENQTAIDTVTATDVDTDNSAISFSVSGSELSITSAGVLTFASSPDYETKTSYSATVTATDGANSTKQDITVNVTNVNDIAPVFTSTNNFSVVEGQIAIGTVTATDAEGDDITFTISGTELAITSEGVLTFVSAPDYETKSSYSATLTASDGENSSSQEIQISIKYGYEYADHWDSHLENLNKIRAVYTNEIGFNLDEIWFKTLSIPKNKFTTTRFDYFLEEPNLSGAVGVGTWFTKNEKTFYFHCNWSPFAPNQGGIKIFEYSNGEFEQFIYKSVQGCNHPFSIQNKDGTSQIVFLALDEGKRLIDEENVGKTYTFDIDTYEFFELEPEFGSHGQSVFDYEQDGDLDIISNDFGNTVSDAQPFILRNDGTNDFEIVKVPQIDYTPGGPYYYSQMSASAFYSGDLLNVVYTDFNIGRKVENEWGIELNKNVIVSYEKESFEIVNVSQLPSPYSEENFSNIEPYNQGFLNGNGISHDVRSTPIDIDYDGDIDIIIGSQVYGETISLPQILINNNGVYEDETSSRLFNWMYATGSMHRWDFADVNDDGYLDIVTKDGCIGIFQDQDGQIIEVDKQYGCERKVAINDGTGHFLAIIEPTQIMQISEGNEFKFYRVHPIFAMDSDRILSWIGLDGDNCNGCYADGNWEIFYTKLDKPLSTGPAGMDPSIVGEPGFNEFYYLLHHPDVRAAILDGKYENGLEHYLAAGKDLGYAANAKGTTHIVVESYGVNPSYSIN